MLRVFVGLTLCLCPLRFWYFLRIMFWFSGRSLLLVLIGVNILVDLCLDLKSFFEIFQSWLTNLLSTHHSQKFLV